MIEYKENNIEKNTKNTNTINTKRQYEKKNHRTNDYGLTAEEEELFDGIDEDELVELAGGFNKLMMIMMMIMMNCFYGMVDRRKAFSLISSRDHCQRYSPSRISDMLRAGFEPAQNLSSGLVE